MKKVYERPMMVCDQFTADEFVAACAAVTPYEIDCAKNKYPVAVFGEDNKIVPAWNCDGSEHDVMNKNSLKKGYVYEKIGQKTDVYYWVSGKREPIVHYTKDVETVEAWLRS